MGPKLKFRKKFGKKFDLKVEVAVKDLNVVYEVPEENFLSLSFINLNEKPISSKISKNLKNDIEIYEHS